MPNRPKIGIYWCAACGGCEEAVVDLAEDILGVVEKVNIVFWPCAMDFKYQDLRAMPDGAMLATLLNGAIRSEEQAEMARLLRRKSKYLIAFGSCACAGGVPALANQFSREQILRFVYEESPTTVNAAKVRPQGQWVEEGRTVTLPGLHNLVRSLDQVVAVDYYLPGCPPTPKLTKAALGALLDGRMPPKGSVLAPDIALCEECSRRDSKPTDLAFVEFHRPHQKLFDPDKCFLAQGVVCMGPATRQGCGAQCISGCMPCTGCFGPTDRVKDQGAKMLSSLCANLAAKEDHEIDLALEGLPDPVGTLYRYGLARGILRGKATPG
jgi:F420-non-reducing hydrogenase small subunit